MLTVATDYALALTEGAALAGRSLPELEAVIERGLQTFMEVGRALKEIRDRDLHHEAGFKNFDTYCKERWGFSRVRSTQLIGASEVVTIVTTSGLPAPANEGQARAMAPLKDEPEQMAAAWQEAVETAPNGKVTAAHVTEVVERYADPAPPDVEEGADGEPPEPAEAAQFWAARNALWTLKASAQEQSNRFGGECYPEDLKRSQLDDLTKRVEDAVASVAAIDRVLNTVKEAKQRPDWKQPKQSTRRTAHGGQKLVRALEEYGAMTQAELEERTGTRNQNFTHQLKRLVQDGLVLRADKAGRSPRGRPAALYSLQTRPDGG